LTGSHLADAEVNGVDRRGDLGARDLNSAGDRRHPRNPEYRWSRLVVSSRADSAAPACLVDLFFKHGDLLTPGYLDHQRVPGRQRDQLGVGRCIRSDHVPLDVSQPTHGSLRTKASVWPSPFALIEPAGPAVDKHQRLTCEFAVSSSAPKAGWQFEGEDQQTAESIRAVLSPSLLRSRVLRGMFCLRQRQLFRMNNGFVHSRACGAQTGEFGVDAVAL